MLYLITLLISHALALPLNCSIQLTRVKDAETELGVVVDGKPAGYLRYRVTAPTEAVITNVFIHEGYRGSGLSSALMADMMDRAPFINKIEALLVMTNLNASGLKHTRVQITDEQCRRSAEQTPLVRSLKRLGFSLHKCYFNPAIVYLEVEMTRE